MTNEVNVTTYQSIGGKKMAKPNPKAKLGSGGRFAALKAKLGKEKGVNANEAGAIAANAGREKYGKDKMQKMAIKGRMNEESGKHEKTESKKVEDSE